MIQQILATYVKNRQICIRAYPVSLIVQRIVDGVVSVCFPAFIYFFLFKRDVSTTFITYTGTDDYLSYIVLGNCCDVLSVAILMNVGRCMISEIREGTLEPFLISPASRIAYFVGCYMEQFRRAILEFVVVLLIGMLFGTRISIYKVPLLIFFILFISTACFTVSILLSTIMVFTRDTYITQNTLFLLVNFLSGVNFPTEYLPKILQIVGNMYPITPLLRAFRLCVLGGENLNHVLFLLLQAAVLSIVYFFIGYLWFRKLERKLVEQVLA